MRAYPSQPWRVMKLVWSALLAALLPLRLRDLPLVLDRYLQHLGRANERTRQRRIDAFLHGYESRDRLALQLIGASNHRGLGNRRMIDQRTFHFHGADTMPRHVQNVIDAAKDPEEAVRVTLRAIAWEIEVGPLRPVVLFESLIVAVNRA